MLGGKELLARDFIDLVTVVGEHIFVIILIFLARTLLIV